MATNFKIAFELGAQLTSSFRSAFSQANQEMSNLLNVSKKMTSMGTNMTMGVTAPLVGMGAMAVKTFAGFDDSMRNVQAVSGATGEEFQQLTQLAKDLGASTAWSASQSADAMGYLALAGWDTNQIMEATPGLLNLASAASMDLAGAADIVSDVMSAFGMSADQAGQAADMFAATSSKSNTDVAQLGEGLKYAGAAAAAAGMDLAQTNAVLGVFADSGIKGSMAGTTMVSMLRDLKNNAKDGKLAVGETTIALYDQAGNMRDLGTVMGDVEKATKGMTTQQRDAALGALFGTEAMKGANIMLATGSERYNELEEAIRNSEGTAQNMAEIMEGGIGGAIRSLLSALESLAISFGETLAPYIKSAAEVIGNFARAISSLPNSVRLVIVVFGMLLAAVGPTLILMGLLIKNTVTVIAAFKAARTVIASLTIGTRVFNAVQATSIMLMSASRAAMYAYRFSGGGLRGVIMGISAALQVMNLAFLANPYFIAAAGLTVLVLAFYKAWKSSETFRTIVTSSVDAAKNAVMMFAQYLQGIGSNLWSGLISSTKNIGNIISSSMKNLGPGIWNGLIESTKDIGNLIGASMKNLGSGMWSGLVNSTTGVGILIGAAMQSEFAEAAKRAISAFVNSVQVGLSTLPGIISMIAPTIATIGLSFLGISGPIGIVIGGVLSLIGFIYRLSQTNETVANAISSAWSAVSTAFAPVMEIFSEAAEQIASEVGPEIEKTMQVIAESVQELGPPFAELAQTFVELGTVIAGMFANNFMTVIDLWSNLATAVIPMLLQILPVVSEVFTTVLMAIADIVMAVFPIIIEVIASIVPIITEIITTVLPMLLEVFMMIFPMILEVIQAVLPIFLSLLMAIVEIVMTLVTTALPMILSVVQMVFPVVLGIIQAIIPIILVVLQMLVSIITGIVIPAINSILAVVQVVFPFIQMVISNALAIITGVLQAAMSLIQGDWSGAWNAIKGIAENIMNNIISFFSGIDLFSVGKAIIDGLINGIKSMAGAVVGAISSIVPAPLRAAVSDAIGAIPGFAEGGVVSDPTLAWVGEGGDTESIIPWNNSQRSKDLWLQTGRAIGMLGAGGMGESANDVLEAEKTPSSMDLIKGTNTTNNYGGGGTVIHLVHKGNTVYVQGNDDAGEVTRKIEESDAALLERIKRIVENERRKDL